jgi:hypothetical protein
MPQHHSGSSSPAACASASSSSKDIPYLSAVAFSCALVITPGLAPLPLPAAVALPVASAVPLPALATVLAPLLVAEAAIVVDGAWSCTAGPMLTAALAGFERTLSACDCGGDGGGVDDEDDGDDGEGAAGAGPAITPALPLVLVLANSEPCPALAGRLDAQLEPHALLPLLLLAPAAPDPLPSLADAAAAASAAAAACSSSFCCASSC